MSYSILDRKALWLHSTFPWDCGWYGQLQIIFIPSWWQSSLTAPLNSPPWSHWMIRGGPCSRYMPFSSSAMFLLIFLFMGRSQTNQLKTFITDKKYLYDKLFNLTAPFCPMSIKSIWCLICTSLARIGFSLALLQNLAFLLYCCLSVLRNSCTFILPRPAKFCLRDATNFAAPDPFTLLYFSEITFCTSETLSIRRPVALE